MNQARGSKSVDISLRQHNGQDWQRSENITARLRKHLADSDLVLIPFGRLSRIRRLSVTPTSLGPQKYDNFDALIADIDFYFDCELDTIRGQVAAMLRLERYATWFSNLWGKLPYETQMLTTIRQHLDTVVAYDPKLRKLRLRYNCFDTLQLAAMGKESTSPLEEDFGWQKWLDAYPKGIPRLSGECLRGQRKKTF
ncbi:uncharacterized protein BJX67DRAFT_340020 [Aspergillus lucknowensis]|uniref:Uncharacterized protein n=1 Tax=Aspergillus lucknowensis TaxID=176173 RepID=A0ABR4M7X6_9EURO